MFFVLEMIGTVAFAVAGALVGIDKKMDVFGVAILGMTTAVGGGVIRDLILNVAPPAAFREPVFALTAIGVSLAAFLPAVRRLAHRQPRLYDLTMLTMDSLGLGSFTVVGVQAAYAAVPEANVFLSSFVGVVTGVGGGILRDVLAGNTPYVFIRHFYACASLLGALCCALLWPRLGSGPAMVLGLVLTLLLRLLAAHFRWSLPRAE